MEIKRNTLMWIIIGVLLLVVIFLTFNSSSLTGNVIAQGYNEIDTSGWTDNEIMNYEMHGTIPSRVQNSQRQSNSYGMVGGC